MQTEKGGHSHRGRFVSKNRKAGRYTGLRELDLENYLRRRNASQLSAPQINKPAVLGSGIRLKLTSSK